MDLKFAIRSFRRNPGFTALSVAILALGIGANTAIFSVVDAVLLRPLAYPDPGRLVSLTTAWKNGGLYGQVSGPDFLDYQSRSTAFTSLAAYDDGIESIVGNGTSEFAGAAEVSSDFFRTLGIQPVAGRGLVASDWKKKASVAVVSAAFWQRHFGNVPFTPGRIVKFENTSFEIVGMLPAGFHFPEDVTTDVWAPFQDALENTNRGGHNYRVIGRLKPGISVEQAQSQLSALSQRLQQIYPGSNKDASAYLTTLTDFTVRRVKTSLYILLAAVVVVLLIACANVANLLLARGSARVRELAVRTSLGATQFRLVRQLLTEAAILSAFGCGFGILLAYALLPLLVRLAPSYLPRLNQIHIDPAVLLFAIGAGCIATLLFGLAPALQARRTDPNVDLRAGGSRGSLGGSTGRLRQAFVVAEVALSVVLLVSAGLLLKSFAATVSVDLGFRPDKLLVAELSVPSESGERVNHLFYQPLLARLSQTPGVTSAALSHTLPGDSATRSDGAYIIDGQTMKDFTVNSPQAGFSVVSRAYFQTLHIPLLAGRDFSDRDGLAEPPVAIISASLARRAYPRQNAVGHKILCGLDLESMKWMQIVGVVGDIRMDGPTIAPTPEIYMAYLQHPRSELSLIVNARNNPMAFAGPLRRDIRALDPEASLKLTTMENHLADVVSTPRFSSTLVSAFAALAILLAAIGIYGVMAYSVVQRTSEIGLRIALGADRRRILGLVLSQATTLTAMGLVLGTIGAAAAGRLLKSQLFEVSASDPAIYITMLVLLAALTLAASFIPAWRACRIEPLDALRQE